MFSYESLTEELELAMMETVAAADKDFAGYRTGKAAPSLVENVMVEYYGTQTRLREIAGITAPEPRLLVVQPWDRNALANIEKALMAANIGIRPMSDGRVIRLPIPELSEERRRDLVKQMHKRAEEGRVIIRSHRRDANEVAKKAQKDGHVSEDEVKLVQEKVQDLTDVYIKAVDDLVVRKEKELMQV